ncbi:MAG: DNA polymerase III subunit chi [Arsenophonus sp.]
MLANKTFCGSARDILIYLPSTFTKFAITFHEVIDFVSIDKYLKQLACERYKTYRNMDFNLIIEAEPPTLNK